MDLKFDILELLIAAIIGFILGCVANSCFSSPSSKAQGQGGLSVPANFNTLSAGETRHSHHFTKNHQKRNLPSLSGLFVNKDVSAKVTAYCPCRKCCGKWSDGYTASGHKIRKGDRFAAADKSIPFGTMLIIPGYNDSKPVPVLDRGGVIKGNRIDVYFDTHKQAKEWGVKELKLQVQRPRTGRRGQGSPKFF